MKKKQQTPYWFPCPICKKKTDVKVHEDTTRLYFPPVLPPLQSGNTNSCSSAKNGGGREIIVNTHPRKSSET